jgi:hydroxymethylbilane synthase
LPVGGSQEIENEIQALTHFPTLAEITAERAFLATIGASCVSPVGVNARASDESIKLSALLFSADGKRSLRGELAEELPASRRDKLEQTATRLGERLGCLMLERGAGELVGP